MAQDQESPSSSVENRKRAAKWIFSSLPLLLSTLALLVSFLGYRLTAVRNVKPAIVVSYSKDGWQLKNVGNGPALNVLVAQRRETGAWVCPVRVPPLGQGDQLHLFWMGHTNVRWIGATYADIDGRPYSSECSDDLTRISVGSVFPQWSEEQIDRAWKLTREKPCPDAG
jgi:hypothetical protein